MDHTQPIDPRKTIFIGGVPRPLKAAELADIFNSRYGNVCYAGIDCDPDLKYPKGEGQKQREKREREKQRCSCVHEHSNLAKEEKVCLTLQCQFPPPLW